MYIRSGQANLILPGKPLAKCYFVAPRHKIRDVQFIATTEEGPIRAEISCQF